MYNLIVLIGKSGSGKDSLIAASRSPLLHRVVRTTTRPKRAYEQDGTDYHFTNIQAFGEKVLNNQMAEASAFNDWFYGTEYTSLLPASTGIVNIAAVDPTAARNLKDDKDINLVIIYIDTKDNLRLIRQLSREQEPNIEEIMRRYKADALDFLPEVLDFPHITLTNNMPEDLEVCRQRIEEIASSMVAQGQSGKYN